MHASGSVMVNDVTDQDSCGRFNTQVSVNALTLMLRNTNLPTIVCALKEHNSNRPILTSQMSQSDSESDIWEYKSLRKKSKRQNGKQNTRANSQGRGKRKHEAEPQDVSNNKNKRTSTVKKNDSVANGTNANKQPRNDSIQMKEVNGGRSNKPPPADTTDEDKPAPVNETPKPPPKKGHCPICQMPFSILVVQSERWHVSECLETPGNDSQGKSLVFILSRL